MILKSLRLLNFRNHKSFQSNFVQYNIILGPNASGKTNLLEAIYLLSVARSFKTTLNQNLISFGESYAKVLGVVEREDKKIVLEVRLIKNKEFKKEIQINQKPRRVTSLLGNFLTVLFRPESLELVLGSPSIRRQALDIILSTVSKKYTYHLIDFHKILKQRNKLLLKIKEGQASFDVLGFWDEQFIKTGNFLREARSSAIEELNSFLPSNFRLIYLPYPPSDLSKKLKEVRKKEAEAGFSLIGPQKDNFVFEYNKKPLALFGSRGEIREGVVFFKLAEKNYIKKKTGLQPALLLDDIFSELDKKRREMVKNLFDEGQIFLTATSLTYLGPELIKKAKVLELK